MNGSLPNIFEFINYRDYLEAYRLARKEWDEGFTHTYICFRLGQRSSRTLYNNIVRGRKDLSPEFIKRFVQLLELNQPEAAYFRVLVMYNQSTDLQEKELYFDQLVQMNNTPKRKLGEEHFEYYNHWYYSSIRALLDIYDFTDDYAALAQKLRPTIKTAQAKDAIALLDRLGLIVRNDDGFWRPTQKALTTGAKVNHHQVMQYQLQCMEQARMALLDADVARYRSSTLTVSVSDEGLARIMKRTEQYRKELFAIVNKDEQKANRVYQINVQLIAQTE